MVEKYCSITGTHESVKVIEKSRFITTSKHIESEEEAKEFIVACKKKYFDATHNCSAYIADNVGNLIRFSDDGEPQGTAGMPMLDVLVNKKLYQLAVVVTRYFGGIKLGAGGLVRAYSGCVAENLAEAKKVCYQMCSESQYLMDYSLVDRMMRYCQSRDCDVLHTEYGNDVMFTVAVKKEDEQSFNDDLFNSMNGRIIIQKVKEYFFPFPINE